MRVESKAATSPRTGKKARNVRNLNLRHKRTKTQTTISAGGPHGEHCCQNRPGGSSDKPKRSLLPQITNSRSTRLYGSPAGVSYSDKMHFDGKTEIELTCAKAYKVEEPLREPVKSKSQFGLFLKWAQTQTLIFSSNAPIAKSCSEVQHPDLRASNKMPLDSKDVVLLRLHNWDMKIRVRLGIVNHFAVDILQGSFKNLYLLGVFPFFTNCYIQAFATCSHQREKALQRKPSEWSRHWRRILKDE